MGGLLGAGFFCQGRSVGRVEVKYLWVGILPSLLVLDCSPLTGFPQEKQLFLCQNAKWKKSKLGVEFYHF